MFLNNSFICPYEDGVNVPAFFTQGKKYCVKFCPLLKKWEKQLSKLNAHTPHTPHTPHNALIEREHKRER